VGGRGEPRNLANGAAEFGKICRGKPWSLVISLVRLIAAAQRRVWQLLAWLNPVVIPGLHAGTRCAVLRGSLYECITVFIDVLIYSAAKLQVCSINLLYFTSQNTLAGRYTKILCLM